MAATFEFELDTGASTGSPAKGTTRTGSITECNWKNADDSTTAYNTVPITAGNNSYEKFLFGHYSGSFSAILNGKFAHTAGSFGTGLTLKGTVSGTYTTPSTVANSALTTDMTSAISIGVGLTVQFGATGPEAAGKGSSSSSNPSYTQYLTTQLQTTSSAAAGDTATATLTLQYDEN